LCHEQQKQKTPTILP